MNFSYQDNISIEEIMADVTENCNDKATRVMSKGWYIAQIRLAMDEMGFDAKFDVRYEDFKLNGIMNFEMPKGSWNLRDIFVWNQDPNGCCIVNSSHRVFHKSNFLSKGLQQGYTARNKTGQYDYFTVPFSSDSSVMFYNIQNGLVMLSDACQTYEYCRLVFNGLASTIDEAKIVPHFARQAIIMWVTEKFWFKKKATGDPQARTQWIDSRNVLYTAPNREKDSLWVEAEKRFKRLDKKHWEDLNEYFGRGSW